MRFRGGKRQKKQRRLKASVKLFLFICCIAMGFWAVDLQIRPVVKKTAEYQAKALASVAIHDAILKELEKNQIQYNRLANLRVNQEGMVTSVETNVVNVNILKSRIVSAITDALQEESEQELKLPAGTLLGGQFLSGRGPEIPFRVLPLGYVQAEIRDKFTSAGINQTQHQVILTVTTDLAAIIPGISIDMQYSTNFCLAETVIIGAVPGAFTQVTGDDSSILGKINDYQAILGEQ